MDSNSTNYAVTHAGTGVGCMSGAVDTGSFTPARLTVIPKSPALQDSVPRSPIPV